MSITTSSDLATLLNSSSPLTPEDAAEGPRDWTAGLIVDGDLYEVDTTATTRDTLVLANGTAIRFSPAGQYCGGEHAGCGHVRNAAVASSAAHWAPADYESWGDAENCGECSESSCGVVRDYRTVTVWDANGFTETITHDTVEAAKAAYTREVSQLTAMAADLNYHAHDADEG
ncbi:hypothetical protein KVH02_34845 [Streptomyces olivaceus]|uniref:Uncharacterized protein n=1 Tax=Streptomyces olivaceus TaxID=47716 RepID=A0ABS7WE94_STROV|nr:hypothetical protein [Streptomyces olivaceus]MBZ6093443.1 hypothetical protein [Streptomyces olivaceus]MBZ6100530.1 hypothetical protein [Streptomyces olivaceus]MBZ6121631.1 hypothetical protein [Streptomyces olivaceus]MBZ6156276.1 hypothetical protein [Streptomyces olivaceus]MBZ6302928.1 hypothetical protein [Streptomyces olivaceus]